MMETEKVIVGTVWEVPLELDLGYGYLKLIDSCYLDSWGWLVYIYDLNRRDQWKGKDISTFNDIDYLTSPLLGFHNPPQRGEKRWKKLGILPLLNEECLLPEFKAYQNKLLSPHEQKWSVTIGGSAQYANKYGDRDYETVKHLGCFGHKSLRVFSHRVTMEWLRKLGMDYNYYEANEVDSDFIRNQKYEISITPLYTEVPKNIRNRILK